MQRSSRRFRVGSEEPPPAVGGVEGCGGAPDVSSSLIDERSLLPCRIRVPQARPTHPRSTLGPGANRQEALGADRPLVVR
jgi:hypothetical protein